MSSNSKDNATIETTASALIKQHASFDKAPNITIAQAGQFLDRTLGVLFPQLAQVDLSTEKKIAKELEALSVELLKLLKSASEDGDDICTSSVEHFITELPRIGEEIRIDAQAMFDGDPAASSLNEVIITYPGCYAVAAYRIAHIFYQLKIPLFPRLLGEYAHRVTGVDIHPGATIGAAFCLDHATGVVVGESSVIGNNVRLYQGVTLGATKVGKDQKDKKRHPTLNDNVVVYANATILGGNTVVGHDSVIGGNVWLTKSVLPYSRVMYQPADSAESGLNWTI